MIGSRALILLSGLCVVVSACSDKFEQSAQAGDFTLTVNTEPAVLQVGKDAEVILKIRDTNNQPVTGCHARFRQHMPGMGMELDNTFFDLTDTESRGIYRGQSGNFSMGGDWVIEFMLECRDEPFNHRFRYHLDWPE